ncbi:hypothetical protein ANN_20877 [Periplaneta americana]|uniref:CUB domain-containing protein n=1 Tax=Periplaneta americana TaxID=6978 RepID=A0ABQ8SEK8_PERAM|nr:hypothetical protein ANN_20877 [Periplaneta americana]
MYPNNYRNASQCRWDVSVPVETQPLLKFTVFDIGSRSTCTSDFLEIYDVDLENNVETFVSRYCGEDNPVIHEGSTGTISVRYVTSMHNGGTGWVAHFIARKPEARRLKCIRAIHRKNVILTKNSENINYVIQQCNKYR